MTGAKLTYKEFVKLIAEKFFYFEISKHITNFLETAYAPQNYPAHQHKAIVQTIINELLINNDIKISNSPETYSSGINKSYIKEHIVKAGIRLYLSSRFTNIYEINKISENIFFVNIENELLFDTLLNFVTDTAISQKNKNGNITVFNIETGANTNSSYLSSAINKAIHKKLPIMFFIWETAVSPFTEIDSRLAYYGGFMKIISNFPPSKVTYKNLQVSNYLEIYEEIKTTAEKTRTQNIPAVFHIREPELVKTNDIFKTWILETGLMTNEKTTEISEKAEAFANSVLSENFFEKFLYELCKCEASPAECSPEEGLKLLLQHRTVINECILKKYPYLKNFGSNIQTVSGNITEIKLPASLPKLRQASYMAAKMLSNGRFTIQDNIPENEFLYAFLTMKENTFFTDIPASVMLLKNIKNTNLYEAAGCKRTNNANINIQGLYIAEK